MLLWRRCLAFTLEMPFKDTEDRPDPEQVQRNLKSTFRYAERLPLTPHATCREPKPKAIPRLHHACIRICTEQHVHIHMYVTSMSDEARASCGSTPAAGLVAGALDALWRGLPAAAGRGAGRTAVTGPGRRKHRSYLIDISLSDLAVAWCRDDPIAQVRGL